MAQPSVNTELLDANLRHQIGVMRFSNGMVSRMVGLMNKADGHLFAELASAIERGKSAAAIARLDAMLQSVRDLNARVYQQVESGIKTDVRDLAEYEIDFQTGLLKEVPGLPINAVTLDQVYGAVTAKPFQGRLLSEWAKSIETDRMARIRDTIRMGIVSNETTSQIVQRIRGTKANGYADGIIQIDRRNAEAVVRSAISHTAAVTRDFVYQANSDLIKAVQWVSTLDSRTSPICRARDGLRYTCADHRPVGHAVPWLGGPGAAHWSCRSISTPVLKSYKELGIDMPDMPNATRASMDGQVPSDTTYGEWFARQSAARQDVIVGPTRGQLFRKGGIAFDSFANDKGRMLTLAQLREIESGAFRKAGL
jgi:SPP1 gp7 family putative phage head morphogenesis protein